MLLTTLIRFLLFTVLVNSLDGQETTTIWSQRMNDQVNDGMNSEVTTEIGSNNSSDSSSILNWLFPSFRNSSENSTGKYLEAEQRSSSDQESSTNWSERNLMVTEETTTEMNNSNELTFTEESTKISSDKSTVSPAAIILKWLMSSRNSSENIIGDGHRNKSNLVMEKRSGNESLKKAMEECEDEANYKKVTTQKPIETTTNDDTILIIFPEMNDTDSDSNNLNGSETNGWLANLFTLPNWYSGLPWIN